MWSGGEQRAHVSFPDFPAKLESVFFVSCPKQGLEMEAVVLDRVGVFFSFRLHIVFPLRFTARVLQCAWAMNRWGKNSVYKLQYGLWTRLVSLRTGSRWSTSAYGIAARTKSSAFRRIALLFAARARDSRVNLLPFSKRYLLVVLLALLINAHP